MSALDSKKPRLLTLIGLVSLVVALWVVLFAGTTSITQTSVEKHLQRFASYTTTAFDENGRVAKFTYGEIVVGGWGFNQHATVENVTLSIADKATPDSPQWVLSTPKMEVIPDSTARGALYFVFSDPVAVVENGQPKVTVTFSAPVKYSYYDGSETGTSTIAHTVHLPTQITLSAPKTGDETTDKKNQPVIISYDENPVFHIKIQPDRHEREATYEFRNLRIVTGEGAQATVASLLSHLTEKQDDSGQAVGKYTLMLSDLAVHDRQEATKAYSLSADVDYTGTDPMAVTLNQLLLVAEDFKISAAGKLSIASDDPLPSGNLSVDIDNVKQMLASDLLPEQVSGMLAHALQKITGQPTDAPVQVMVPLKRQKNGQLYVGKLTFEELAASILGDMLQPKSAPSSKTKKKEEIPAPVANPDAPASIPDNAPAVAKPESVPAATENVSPAAPEPLKDSK